MISLPVRCGLVVALAATAGAAAVPAAQGDRPNILWLVSEDNGPHIGAYGDDFADTPELDALADRGMIYNAVWSNAPVCAAARSTIISGVYATALGSHHHRSRVRLPDRIKLFPEYLRDAGYYTTNNAKTDYNFEMPGTGQPAAPQAWDESSRQAHWSQRPAGAPFFAVFNFNITHESSIRRRPHEQVHDPALVRLPAYYPDAPEIRRDWAQYYDRITQMDAQAGARLAEVAAAGLADSTIVFYYGDHGIGLPRGKRSTMDSGLRVPLIVYVPERFRDIAGADYVPGGASDRLVSFVDLAPTVLSLAGIEPPGYMQGAAFMGRFDAAPHEYLYGFRGRMDERYDMVRSVRDGRYVYVRNFEPHRSAGQHVAYMFETPSTVAWKALYEAGGLPPEQAAYWEPRAAEELYDLHVDPDEIDNLAASPAHQATLQRLRDAMRRHAVETRDLGFLPEPDMHVRSVGAPPYDYGRGREYAVARILTAAEQASELELVSAANVRDSLGDADGAVRYWGAVGLLIRGAPAVRLARAELLEALDDGSASVRIAAAEALGMYGDQTEQDAALAVLLTHASLDANELFTVVSALNALDNLDERAAPAVDSIAALPLERDDTPQVFAFYVPRLIEAILADLERP